MVNNVFIFRAYKRFLRHLYQPRGTKENNPFHKKTKVNSEGISFHLLFQND